MTENDLINQRELIQDDLTCLLDGLDEEMIDNVCQVIVDRFQILLDKLNPLVVP
jgi:hypothetical protein